AASLPAVPTMMRWAAATPPRAPTASSAQASMTRGLVVRDESMRRGSPEQGAHVSHRGYRRMRPRGAGSTPPLDAYSSPALFPPSGCFEGVFPAGVVVDAHRLAAPEGPELAESQLCPDAVP